VEEIYCVVRNGEVIMNASWTFVAPKLETWENITAYLPVTDVNGRPMYDRTGGVMKKPVLMKVMPAAKALEGVVEYVGAPLKGEVCDLAPGDHVIYRKWANAKVRFGGKNLYAMHQRNIEATISKEVRSG
jgi:hypothetical protein